MVVSWIEIITSEPLELLLDITKLVLLFNYYLFLYIYFYYGWLMFCLNYFALNKPIINTVLLLVSSRVTFNQQFSRRRCFSFYWFGKWEFVKFTNGIPIIGCPAGPSPPLFELFIKHHWLKLKGSSPNFVLKTFETFWSALK